MVAEAVQAIVPTTVDKAAKVVEAAAHLDMYTSMGKTNAHVLPEPVSAMPITSCVDHKKTQRNERKGEAEGQAKGGRERRRGEAGWGPAGARRPTPGQVGVPGCASRAGCTPSGSASASCTPPSSRAAHRADSLTIDDTLGLPTTDADP